ncbi:MAG: hypothetical protein ABSG42_01530 [Nitrospirota bacterium]
MEKLHLRLVVIFTMGLIAFGTVLAGVAEPGGLGIKLQWKAPTDVPAAKVIGYNIYRSEAILGHYVKLNHAPVTALLYEDSGLVKGAAYFYKITTVFKGNTESKPTKPVGLQAGGTAQITLPVIRSFTSDAFGKGVYLGQEAVFVLEGDPHLNAAFSIDEGTSYIQMKEVSPGTYRGIYVVTRGQQIINAVVTAALSNTYGGKTLMTAPDTVSFLGVSKPSVTGLRTGMLESDRVGLNWPRVANGDGSYSVYRDTARIAGVQGLTPISGRIGGQASSYIDCTVAPGATYYYVLAFTNSAGATAYSNNLKVNVPAPERVAVVEAVEEDSNGAVLKSGTVLSVTLKSTPGGKAVFTLGRAIRGGEMSETEPGTYCGTYTVKDGDGIFKAKVAASLKDKSGISHVAYSSTLVTVNAPALKKSPGIKLAARDVSAQRLRTYPGYTINAVPKILPADGVSRANVIVTLKKNGAPEKGKTILFSVSGADGSFNKTSEVTDVSGKAESFFIAGTQAGKVVVTATESSSKVSIDAVVTILAAPASVAPDDSTAEEGIGEGTNVIEEKEIGTFK